MTTHFLRASWLILALALASTSSAQTPPRVFELRTYTAAEGKLPDLEKRFREHTVELFKRHGIASIGYWIPQDAPRSGDTLIYLLAHASREAAKKNWAEFSQDPEWQKFRAESEANGKVVTHIESVFLNPLDFSPMQ